MDPITLIFLVGVGAIVFDGATDGLLRAEAGGRARGAVRGARTANSARHARARARARERRSQTPFGRFLNYLDDEAHAFGREIRSGWRAEREVAVRARRERIAVVPPPYRRVVDRAKARLDRGDRSDPNTPNGSGGSPRTADPNGQVTAPNVDPNGEPNVPDRTEPNGERDPMAGCPWGQCPHPKTAHDQANACTVPGCGCATEALAAKKDADAQAAAATPNRPTPPGAGVPEQRGTTVADITSAPNAIAAWETLAGRFESLQSDLNALQLEAGGMADGMGDFAIGGEGDVSAAFGALESSLGAAKERVDGYVSALHLEYDASIEAASGRQAPAHAPMQEV